MKNSSIERMQDKVAKQWWNYLKSVKKDIKIAKFKNDYYIITFNNGQVFKLKWDIPKEKIPPMFLIN